MRPPAALGVHAALPAAALHLLQPLLAGGGVSSFSCVWPLAAPPGTRLRQTLPISPQMLFSPFPFPLCSHCRARPTPLGQSDFLLAAVTSQPCSTRSCLGGLSAKHSGTMTHPLVTELLGALRAPHCQCYLSFTPVSTSAQTRAHPHSHPGQAPPSFRMELGGHLRQAILPGVA